MFAVNFLYYPKIKTNATFQDNIIVAALIVGILELYTKEKARFPKLLKTFGLFSLILLLFGAFSFMFSASVPGVDKTSLEIVMNQAAVNAIEVASLTSGIFSLFFILFFIMMNLTESKKKIKNN